MSNISLTQANEFHTYFDQQRQSILDDLNSSSNLSDLNSKISDLRARVDQISALIPVYDRVKYDKQLIELEKQVSSIRTRDKPKSKFSFNKSKKSSNTKSSSTPTPGISSSTQPQGEVSSSTSISSPNTHTISNLSHRLIRPPKDVIGTYTLSLSNLSDCIIDLRSGVHDNENLEAEAKDQARLTAVHGKSLERCVIITSVVGGSILLNEVKESLLILGCQQFRIHSSSDTTILLHVDSLPVIEHCTKLRFGSCPDSLYDTNTNLNLNTNYQRVQDFDWPLPTPSPNWTLLADQEPSYHGALVRMMKDVKSDQEVNEVLKSLLVVNTDSS